LCGYKAPCGPDFHPCLWAGRRGFPRLQMAASCPSEAAEDPGPLLLIYSSSPRPPAIHTGQGPAAPSPPLPVPGHMAVPKPSPLEDAAEHGGGSGLSVGHPEQLETGYRWGVIRGHACRVPVRAMSACSCPVPEGQCARGTVCQRDSETRLLPCTFKPGV
jgi:hypothetical protein